jgi:hypothetical protein
MAHNLACMPEDGQRLARQRLLKLIDPISQPRGP